MSDDSRRLVGDMVKMYESIYQWIDLFKCIWTIGLINGDQLADIVASRPECLGFGSYHHQSTSPTWQPIDGCVPLLEIDAHCELNNNGSGR